MANRIHDAFDNIKADERLKESTKQFISERTENQKAAHTPAFRKMAAAFCLVGFCIIGTMFGIRGYSWIQMPVSYVSIDINPSIELGLNRFDRVVSMEAYNEEGEKILKNLSLTWQKCTDAMDAILESEEMSAYLTDGLELVFTTAAESEQSLELQSEVEDFFGGTGHKCHSYSADIEIVSEAHDNGLSLGKYYAYLQLAQYDDTVTVDSCRGMSVLHMHGLAEEHEHNGNHGQGSGHDDVNGGTTQNNSSTQDSSAAQNNSTTTDTGNGHHRRRHHG